MDNYRLLDHKDEIFAMVKKAPVVEIGEIWQTLPVKREIYKIKNMEVLSEALIFSTTLPFDFEMSHPVYIKINFKNLVFKLMPGEFKIYNNQLSCVFPKEARALESRNGERTRLPKKTNLSLTLRTFVSGNTTDVRVTIEDISESGVGIKVNPHSVGLFHQSGVFKIIKVCGRHHLEEGTLHVRHVSPKDQKSFTRVGMSSDKPFSDELFELLRRGMKKGLQPEDEAELEIT